MKVIVFRLENKTTRGTIDKSSEEDQLFGNGIRAQIVSALQQTGQFIIQDNTGPRKVLWGRALTPRGTITREARQRFGSFGDAEFLLAGAITAYQPSRESKDAGIAADLLFRESQAQGIGITFSAADKVFGSLPVASQDHVEIELRLLNAKTGETIDTTTVTGTPHDSAEAIGGIFGQYLAANSSTLQTPMQRALRGCAVKAANWVAEKGMAFRERPFESATPASTVTPVRKKRTGKRRPVTSNSSILEQELSVPSTSLPVPAERVPQENQTDEWGHER